MLRELHHVMVWAALRDQPDHAPRGPDFVFPTEDLDVIVEILQDVKSHAVPVDEAS